MDILLQADQTKLTHPSTKKNLLKSCEWFELSNCLNRIQQHYIKVKITM